MSSPYVFFYALSPLHASSRISSAVPRPHNVSILESLPFPSSIRASLTPPSNLSFAPRTLDARLDPEFPGRSINNRIGEHRFESKLFHSGIFRILQISVPIFRYNYKYIYMGDYLSTWGSIDLRRREFFYERFPKTES